MKSAVGKPFKVGGVVLASRHTPFRASRVAAPSNLMGEAFLHSACVVPRGRPGVYGTGGSQGSTGPRGIG